MKTPWINDKKMKQLCFKQTNSLKIKRDRVNTIGTYGGYKKKTLRKRKRVLLEDVKNRYDHYDYSHFNRNDEDEEYFSSYYDSDMKDSKNFEHSSQNDHGYETVNKYQSESVSEMLHSSISSSEKDDDRNTSHDTEEIQKCGNIYSMTKKTPFSILVEIKDFLHPPVFGGTVQNKVDFIDLDDKLTPQLNTKQVISTTHYPEEPYCRLIWSKTYESLFLTSTDHAYGTNNIGNQNKSVVTPLHDTSDTNKTSDPSRHFITIRVPVVVGEYKLEISLEEDFIFEDEIMRLIGISKEVVLTESKFVPTQFNQLFNNGTGTALKGNLFLKGYIHQNIDYSVIDHGNSKQNESVAYQMHQKMVLELFVHLLQIQQIRNCYDGNEI